MSVKHILKEYIKMFVQDVYLPMIYKKASRQPIEENKVIFADAHNHHTPYSMRRMEAACRDAGFKVETFYSDYQKDGLFASYSAMIAFMRSYGTAHAVVISDTFLPVAGCDKRPETKVVQLWHGAGAMKKFGYATTDDVPGFYKSNIYKNYDLITVSGKLAEEPFASSMRADPGCARAIGVSRTDNYFDEDYMKRTREKVYGVYTEARGKKVILYAPTFRGNADSANESESDAVAQMLKERLPEGWYLITSAHPHAREEGSTGGGLCSEEIMLIADVLITDYSSIVFDYLFLHRPVILYAPDYESFGRIRGFYTPYEELPGRIVTDPDKLTEAIRSEVAHYDPDATDRYLEKYLEACDGNATARIVEYLK